MSTTIHNTALTFASLAEISANDEGIDVALSAEKTIDAARVTALTPRWRGGYHGELVDMERAIDAAWQEAIEAAPKERVSIAPLRLDEGSFPDEPGALILYSTLARLISESKTPPSQLALVVSSDAEAAFYKGVLDEFTRTMMG